MLGEVYALRQALLVEIDAGTLSSNKGDIYVSDVFPEDNGVKKLPGSIDIVSANRILTSTASEIGIVIDVNNEKKFVRRSSLEKLINRLGFDASEIALSAVSHKVVPIEILGLTFGDFVKKFIKNGCFGALLLGERGQIKGCVSIDMILRKVKDIFQSTTLPSGVLPRYH